jgi:hypothetical protein
LKVRLSRVVVRDDRELCEEPERLFQYSVLVNPRRSITGPSQRSQPAPESLFDGYYADSDRPDGLYRRASTNEDIPVLKQRQVVGVKDLSGHPPGSEAWSSWRSISSRNLRMSSR